MNPQSYGPTGAMTTKLGLGGAFITRSSFADGVATVRRALELGVRYFDTSPMYCRGASQPDIDTIIIGAKVPAEIAECVQAAEKGPLPDDLIQKIEGDLL